MQTRYLVIGFIASFLGTVFFWLIFFSFIFGPDYFIENSFPAKYVVSSSKAVQDNPMCYGEIGHLISKGIIVDVKEIWEFQGEYYATLISFLTAILGLLGVVAFFYIKSASLDKSQEAAEKAAIKATAQNLKSFEFVDSINTAIEKRSVGYNERLETKILDIEKKISSIASAISASDHSENDGAELNIDEGE
ncbi:hypothetical protein ACFL6N_07595 [Thermodesulfobacteriota bacterium]